MVLESVYEQDFLDYSYGFRPGRSAHQAVQAVWKPMSHWGPAKRVRKPKKSRKSLRVGSYSKRWRNDELYIAKHRTNFEFGDAFANQRIPQIDLQITKDG